LAVPKPEEKRRVFERLANIREVVFGIQDGVLTTAGVLAGLSGAVSGRSQVIVAALTSTVAGALSMGAGAYQALYSTAEEKVYGLSEGSFGNPALDGVLMGVAFLLGALVALLPFVLITSIRVGLIAGLAATALVLFAVGYFVEGRLGEQRFPALAGARFLLIALGAAAIGYVAGLVLSPLGVAT
jgi:VIT1/CCC1 family predicted Fe2+/Mn2+ transporter